MKALTEPVRLQKPTNCNGPLEWFIEQDFEIEAEDAGKPRDHYLGYKHKTYTILRSDVGRRIRVTKQGDYSCWGFLA
jgi:hypothetical protein